MKKEGCYVTFYCPDSITAFAMNATRAGSAKGEIQVSNDGKSFSKIDAYETKKKGNFQTTTTLTTPALYVRVTNTSGGTLYIHGIKVFKPGIPDPTDPDNPDNPDDPNNPDNPDDPNNPDNPDEPENPDNPDEPENPEEGLKDASTENAAYKVLRDGQLLIIRDGHTYNMQGVMLQ